MGSTTDSKFTLCLLENRDAIVDQWVDILLATYATDGASFFKRQKDQFANPVGHTVKVGLGELFDLLCRPETITALPAPLLHLLKIRAVQTFTVTEAVSFIYAGKELVRQRCKPAELGEALKELFAFESRCDQVALLVFEEFVLDRERVHKIRLRELTSGTHILTDGSKCPSAVMRQK